MCGVLVLVLSYLELDYLCKKIDDTFYRPKKIFLESLSLELYILLLINHRQRLRTLILYYVYALMI